MLQLFRTNQVFALPFLIVYAVILRMYVFIYPLDWEVNNAGFVSQLVYNAVGSNTITANIIALVLVLIQAIMVNEIVRERKLARENSYFPAMAYILLASALPEFLALSPLLMANTFLIGAIWQMSALFKKTDVSSQLFNVGFWIAMASLFYFGQGIFLILGIISLFRLRSFRFNELIVLLIGFGIPFFLVGTYQYWNDNLANFWTQEVINHLSFFDFNIELSGRNYLKIGFYLFLIIWTILSSSSYYLRTGIQTRKIIGLLLSSLFIAFLSLVYQKNINIDHLAILNVPLAIFLSFNLIIIKNRAIAEFLHLLLFLLIIIMQYRVQLIDLLIAS